MNNKDTDPFGLLLCGDHGNGSGTNATADEDADAPAEKPYVYEIDEGSPIDVIHVKVNTLDDLITIGRLREESDFLSKNYTVNVDGLYKMIPALEEFKSMIGLEDIKAQVVDQIVYLSGKNHSQFQANDDELFSLKPPPSQEMNLLAQLLGGNAGGKQNERVQYNASENVLNDDNQYDMFHTVIYGSPGVGKTAFAKILARIFLCLGVTQGDKFRIASRSDLVGEYVGHTAMKTQKVIDEAMGGVLFIDEIYSLGNGGSKNGESRSDSFSHECINTLNQNLTERKGQFICIIAGYKKETEQFFFGLNPGLKRRFSFYYNIEGYDWEELTRILIFKIERLQRWNLHADTMEFLLGGQFLKERVAHFPHYAGDIETLLLNIKISHCKRVFGKELVLQRCITSEDVEQGFKRFLIQKQEDNVRSREEEERLCAMYS